MTLYKYLLPRFLILLLILLFVDKSDYFAVSSNYWQTLVNGQTLSGWHGQDQSKPHEWQTAHAISLDPEDNHFFVIEAGKGIFVNGKTGRTQNLVSQQKFGDVEVHIEFTVPHKSNSGIYLMGLYEVQVQDDFGTKNILFSTCGGFYARKIWDGINLDWQRNGKWIDGTPPLVNACKPPGIWQTFDVKFRTPRFNSSGRKIQNAKFIEVKHNGTLIHKNIEILGPNSAHMPLIEAPQGPLMLQGDHGPVAYRNVRIRPLP